MDCSTPGFPVFHYLQSLFKIMSIESVMLSNHLILCHPLLLSPSIFSRIRVFFNQSALCIRWLKCQSFSFSRSPSNKHSGLTSLKIDWFDFLVVPWTARLSRIFSSTTTQNCQFFGLQRSLWSNSHIQTWLLENHSLTIWTFVGKVMSRLLNILSRFVIAFFPRSKHLWIAWLQYSCLENSMDRGAWRDRVHGISKSETWLSK